MMKRQYRRYTDSQVNDAIKNSFSWRETAFKLGLNGDAGSNNKTLKKIAHKYKIDYSHFKGRGWNLGKDALNAIPLDDLLKRGTLVRSDSLKKKLIKKGLLVNQCCLCGQLPIWNNKLLVLELDHIDGDTLNNELNNLRILCGHCHSQTPTFRGRKLKKEKKKRCKKIYSCKICGKNIFKTKHKLCRVCFLKKDMHKKVKNRPSKEQLLKEIEETNYCETGRKYGVSDNAVRKWVK